MRVMILKRMVHLEVQDMLLPDVGDQPEVGVVLLRFPCEILRVRDERERGTDQTNRGKEREREIERERERERETRPRQRQRLHHLNSGEFL